MQNVIHAFAGTGDCIGIAQIALHKLDAIKNSSKVFFAACFKIIEAANCFSALNKRLADPGAEKSGAAGYKITIHVFSMVAAETEAV